MTQDKRPASSAALSFALSPDDVAQYRRDGFVGPYPALVPEEVRRYRKRLETFEASRGDTLGNLDSQIRAKTHLLFPWVNELVRHPRILDAVQGLVGPDILLYHVTCWLKEPGDGSFVTWHQDGAYFNLEPAEHVTAWIALSDATPQSGCLRLLPGSHTAGPRPHVKGETRGNLLSNGQLVPDIEPDRAVWLPVPAGHFSLHHTHVLHESGPNQSDERRIGIGASYIPTRVRFTAPRRVTATLVRGRDNYGHFDPEVTPAQDFSPAARQFHAEAVARFFAAHGSKRTEETTPGEPG